MNFSQGEDLGLWGIDDSPGPRIFMSMEGINRMDRREDTHIGLQRLVYSC